MDIELLDHDTLELLRDSLARYGRERYDFESRCARLATPEGFGREAWKDYAEMGWLAMPQPVEAGGFGSAPQAVGALMEFAGRSLALEPLFASVVLGGRLLGLLEGDAGAQAMLEALAEGRALIALAHGESDTESVIDQVAGAPGGVDTRCKEGRLHGHKRLVLHGDAADILLVTARDTGGALRLYQVAGDAPGLSRQSFRLADGRGAAHLTLQGVPGQALGGDADIGALLERTYGEACLALCADTLGASQALNALTLAYLKERRQFGVPIGSYQALQHRMVELYMLETEGRAVLNAAHRAGPDARRAATHAALAHVMHLGRQASHEAVQMHGGIGVTEELAVSHYFRRILVNNRLLGDRDAHLRRFAEAQGLT